MNKLSEWLRKDPMNRCRLCLMIMAMATVIVAVLDRYGYI